MPIRAKLLCILTEYDKRRAKRKDYNPYALPQYIQAIGGIVKALDDGQPLPDALKQGFCGALLRHVAKKLGLDVKYQPWE